MIESRHPRFGKNSYVYGQFGWQTHVIINPDREDGCKVYPLPDFGHRSISLGLGVLGMPGYLDSITRIRQGLTMSNGNFFKQNFLILEYVFNRNAAYFGFTEICQPKRGETIVVSSAAGGIGIHVGQLAKIHGTFSPQRFSIS